MTAPDLSELAASMPSPDPEAHRAALQRWDLLAKPPGSLGGLEELGAWVCATQGRCPPQPLRDVRVVVFAGDHGIVSAGVSAYPSGVTAAMVRTVVAGGAAVNVLAREAGAQVRVLDMAVDEDLSDLGPAVVAHKVRRGTEPIDRTDATTREEAAAAFSAGRTVADEAVDSGAQLLVVGDLGIGNTTPAAVLTGLLTRSEVVEVVGRGSGVDDAGWMRKAAAVRDAMFRARGRTGDPLDLLAAVGGPDIAAMTGFLVQAAWRRTPVVLDGVVSGAAALLAQRVSFRTPRWLQAGHLSVEPAHAKALHRLGLEPLVQARLHLGEGTGALVAVPQVRAAAALLAEMSLLSEVVSLLDAAPAPGASGTTPPPPRSPRRPPG